MSVHVEDKIPVYSFPTDPTEKAEWVRAMPDDLNVESVTKHMGLCAIHFPNAKMRKIGNNSRPIDPPSYFPGAPRSSWGPSPFKKRCTLSAAAETRRPDPGEELNSFLLGDLLNLDTFTKKLQELCCVYSGTLVWHKNNTSFSYLSSQRDGPVFNYSIHFKSLGVNSTKSTSKIKGLEYEAYSGLKKVKHPAIPNTICTWSAFNEVVRFLFSFTEEDDKIKFIKRQIYLNNVPENRLVYDSDDMCQAFSLYTLSRHMYSKLRLVIKLPAIRTLQNITGASKKVNDLTFFKSFFAAQDERSRSCTLIADEIYVKSCLTYTGNYPFEFFFISNVFKTIFQMDIS